MSADIDADSIGHDLRWGTAAFAKAPTASSSASTTTSPDAASSAQEEESEPLDDSDRLDDAFVEPSSEERAEVWNVSV